MAGFRAVRLHAAATTDGIPTNGDGTTHSARNALRLAACCSSIGCALASAGSALVTLRARTTARSHGRRPVFLVLSPWTLPEPRATRKRRHHRYRRKSGYLRPRTSWCQRCPTKSCAISNGSNSASHGTGVASLVSQDYGIVPDATLLAYQSLTQQVMQAKTAQ